MKIISVETFQVPPRWVFCRIGTDEGVVGWGEPVVEGRADTVQACVAELTPLLLGTDPLRIEDHWQVLTKGGFYRGGPVLASAVAGIDQALWDIAGKWRGAPVHELLGGPVRDRVRMYAWVAGDGTALAEDIAQRREAGLTAVKMTGSDQLGPIASRAEIDATVARVEVARETLGDDGDVALDLHGRFTLANTRRLLPRIEDLHPFFVEEPLVPEESHLLDHVVRCSSVPVATGERLYDRAEFLPVLQSGVAVVQPDLSHAGGITETRKIATLAETFGAHLAPHCPLGPIALAACLQVDFATSNFLIQEQSLGIHYHRGSGADLLDLVLDPAVLALVDGHVERPTGPGLGLEIDEAAVRALAKTPHHWHNSVWRHRDGSFAEW